MNCHDIEPLLSAERDGVLTPAQRSTLEGHVAHCPACAELRTTLSRTMDAFKSESAATPIPDVHEEWQKLRANLSEGKKIVREKRTLAPILWFAAPLAAAAALAFAFFDSSPSVQPTGAAATSVTETAQAEYVEPGDAKASTIVYVDKDSGWLVVWATDNDSDPKI